jgi:hypothetical protein
MKYYRVEDLEPEEKVSVLLLPYDDDSHKK